VSAQAAEARPLTSTVVAIGRIHFEGNIVPLSWFQHLKIAPARPGTQPLPDAVGILILADIIYWYRPAEIRHEDTGQVIGWKRKFKADKLQRSYSQWANLFGFTEKQVMDAIHRLREAGVITTELRTLTVRDRRVNNVLFVEPVPEKVLAMTYRLPSYFEVGDPATLKSGDPYFEVANHYSEVTTNTETSTEINAEITESAGAKAPDHPPDTKPKERKPRPRQTYSAPVEYARAILKALPNDLQRAAIDKSVKNTDGDMALWKKCVDAWRMAGYKPTNIKGILDWYNQGGPPKFNGGTSASQPGRSPSQPKRHTVPRPHDLPADFDPQKRGFITD